MNKIFQKSMLAISILIASVSYSKETQVTKETPVQCEKPCGSWSVVEDIAPCNCGYNCPARINPKCSWDFDIYGDFLYWQAREKDLSPAFRFEIIQTTPELRDTFETTENMDFAYKPAFKVGIGMNSERDDWTFNLEYTRFNATNSVKGSISFEDFDPRTNYFNDSFTLSALTSALSSLDFADNFSAHIRSFDTHWKLDFNIIDFVVGRPYFLGTKLTLSPFYGLRGGWINQNYNTTNIIPITTQTAPRTDYVIHDLGKSKSWLVGARVGVNSSWLLGAGFRFFGNVAGSLNYQNFKVRVKDFAPIQNELTVAQETIFRQKNGAVNPTFDSALGFGWGSYFNDRSWHFDLSAGYEFQFFYNQNAIFGEISSSSDSDGLMLHGLTVAARFDI